MPDQAVPITGGGVPESIPLGLLDLDPQNPRLPEELAESGADQKAIALHIDRHHDPLRVARSIGEHGFFASEPLIVTKANGRYTVVEGNRRLVALLGLTNPELRGALERQTSAWKRLGVANADMLVPCVVVKDREEVDALVGFRHISGIQPWDPFAQARFISKLVDRTGDFNRVAEIVGRSTTEIRSMYRDHDIVEQARSMFDLDTSRVENAFGVFNAAMGIVKLRAYIGAPAPGQVKPEEYPVPEDRKENLQRLFTFVFGDERGRGRVVTDSRQLRRLADVLSESSGAAERVLLRSADLETALDAMVNDEEGARRELRRALRALTGAVAHLSQLSEPSIDFRELVEECEGRIEELRVILW